MSALLLWAVFTPFVAAAAAPFLARFFKAATGYLLTVSFLPALALLMYAPQARAGTPVQVSLPWVPAFNLNIALRADGFSLLFTLIVAGIGVLILCYASAYLHAHERHGRFYSYLLLFGSAMLGLVLADNLVALFAFWEMTSISSYLLIGFWDSRRASQDGAQKALIVTAIGGLALLAAVVMTGLATGNVLLSEIDVQLLRESPFFIPAVSLFILAALTKSAQIPFHLWLPTAMEAPTPVSAYLHSATMVKAGVVLIAKLGFVLEGTGFESLILFTGLATMFWGSYLALRQNDLKALLAYSTVSQLGILMALYGSGHAFAATAHLINHAVFKAALFMIVGIIDHETKTRDISRLSGLREKLPITFVLAVPAALSMAGLPIFGGAISKELFYEAMLHEGFLPIVITVTGSVMTFAYSLRFLSVFFGPYRCDYDHAHEAPLPFWLPALPLVMAVLLFGIMPQTVFGNPFTSATLATYFTNLAAPSFGYHAEGLRLWHGVTLALFLSALTWCGGTALHFARDQFALLQRRLTPGWNMNTLYYAAIDGLELLSQWLTRATQGLSFATHLRLILWGVVLVGASVMWRFVPTTLSPVPLPFIIVAVTVVGGIIGTLLARSRINAIIFVSLAGTGSTLAFILMSAPDLALTQLLIETVTVILFLSVFRFLPRLTRYHRPKRDLALDTVVSVGVGLTVFTALVAVQTPISERIKDFFLTTSHELAGGNNVVNVILVDFRGYDTMGEITVLGIVAVTVYALLKMGVSRARQEKSDE